MATSIRTRLERIEAAVNLAAATNIPADADVRKLMRRVSERLMLYQSGQFRESHAWRDEMVQAIADKDDEAVDTAAVNYAAALLWYAATRAFTQ